MGSGRCLFMGYSSLLKLNLLCMIEVFTYAFLNQMQMKFDPSVRRAELEMRYMGKVERRQKLREQIGNFPKFEKQVLLSFLNLSIRCVKMNIQSSESTSM